MAGTRASTRLAGKQGASPQTDSKVSPNGGRKRKVSDSGNAQSKRDKKVQKKIEDTLQVEKNDGAHDEYPSKESAEHQVQAEAEGEQHKLNSAKPEEEKDDTERERPKHHDGKDGKQTQDQEDERGTEQVASSTSNGALEEDPKRAESLPSNTLERGIIYFFTRGRVNVDDPDSVKDIGRSYLVLRPIPDDVKLGEGPLEDLGNNRLLALPKKILPRSHRDQYMIFVEKAQTTIQDLKENFLPGSDYATKTAGSRHSPAATPIGEGVYSITQLGRNSRLAYMLTLPAEPEDVQKDMGIADMGSFLLSVKNPDQDAPANTSLPRGPDYPREWLPNTQPKHLDYANAQFLLIGEGFGELKTAAQPPDEDAQKSIKVTPGEELGQLEAEDEHRVDTLHGDDAIYRDLGTRKQGHKSLKTTW